MAMRYNVKVITTQGQVALVEWIEDDFTRRAVIPTRDVADGQVDSDNLARGVPYGLDVAVVNVDYPAILAGELHRRGLWTGRDVLARPEEARSACVSMAAQVLAELFREARRTVNSNG